MLSAKDFSASLIMAEDVPLVASDDKSYHNVFLSANTEANIVPTKSSVLREFDPLAQEDKTEKQNISHPVNQQLCFTSVSSTKSMSQTNNTICNQNDSSVNRVSALFNTYSRDHDSKASVPTSILENPELGEVLPNHKSVSGSVLMRAGSQSKSDMIGAQILQIDSVLKTLNMGQFDLSSETGTPTASIEHMSQLMQVKAMPAAAHSAGLQLIGQLGSCDSESSSESEDSSSDSSGDSVELARKLHVVNDSSSDTELESKFGKKLGHKSFPASKGEVECKSLSASEKCDIPFPDKGTVMPMGKVSHQAERLVVIKALPGTPPFDEGTLLWSKEKKSIARIFETFGPVKSPLYSILVESKEHASSLGLTPGQLVYVIPSNMELTKYIFTKQLMKQKGSDASWKDDEEVPTQFQDYSDDDSEQTAKKEKKRSGKKARQVVAGATLPTSPYNPAHLSTSSPSPGACDTSHPANTPAVSGPSINNIHTYQAGHSLSAYPGYSQGSYSDYRHPAPH